MVFIFSASLNDCIPVSPIMLSSSSLMSTIQPLHLKEWCSRPKSSEVMTVFFFNAWQTPFVPLSPRRLSVFSSEGKKKPIQYVLSSIIY